MLADTPNIDGPTRGARIPTEELSDGKSLVAGTLPVRRIGLEQEFFLVDRKGEPRDLADLFLRECREAARAEGCDPRGFEAESVLGMVEITTPPSHDFVEMAGHYLGNLRLALGVASELGLALYPLGTYPLPINPVLRDDPRYRVKASILGHGRFSHAGRCAGAHLHLELPAGTVWPDVKAALDAPPAAQRAPRPVQPRHGPRPGARGPYASLSFLPRKDGWVRRQDGQLQGHPRLRRALRETA
jgi:hypothetical protein